VIWHPAGGAVAIELAEFCLRFRRGTST
jgi:hypothetical protein